MDLQALLNNTNLHNSPTAERFYRLQVQRQKKGLEPLKPTISRPKPGPRSHKLSRDEKIEIRTLRKYNKWDYITIAKATGKSYFQVEKAYQGPVTPQKQTRTGRKPLIRTPQKQFLKQYLESDVFYRELP